MRPGEEPAQPLIFLCTDDEASVVCHEPLGEELDPPRIAALLRNAMLRRKPSRIVVADGPLAESLARELQGVNVVVGDVAVAEQLLEAILEEINVVEEEEGGFVEEISYLEGGRVSPAAIAQLFDHAARLWHAAPWDVLPEGALIEVDLPHLGVRGGCLNIVGRGGGEGRGFVFFRDLTDYADFCGMSVEASPPLGPPRVAPLFGLNFERGADVPRSIREEVMRHAWPVASPEAYPHLIVVDENGELKRFHVKEIAAAAVCAAGLCELIERHKKELSSDEDEQKGSFSVEVSTEAEPRVRAQLRYPFTNPAAAYGEEHIQLEYDAELGPERETWPESSEEDKLHAVLMYHACEEPERGSPASLAHAALHVAIEDLLAGAQVPEVRIAFDRLIDEGLSRHDALHAVASVLSQEMSEMERRRAPFDWRTFARQLMALTRSAWDGGARKMPRTKKKS